MSAINGTLDSIATALSPVRSEPLADQWARTERENRELRECVVFAMQQAAADRLRLATVEANYAETVSALERCQRQLAVAQGRALGVGQVEDDLREKTLAASRALIEAVSRRLSRKGQWPRADGLFQAECAAELLDGVVGDGVMKGTCPVETASALASGLRFLGCQQLLPEAAAFALAMRDGIVLDLVAEARKAVAT